MKGITILEALQGVDDLYVLKAWESQKSNDKKKIRMTVLLIAAIVAVLLFGGFYYLTQNKILPFDAWNQEPGSDPTDVVKSAIEGQMQKEYTQGVGFLKAIVDKEETERLRMRYKDSETAQRNGWTNEYLDKYVIAVFAVYDIEYDQTQTAQISGRLCQYFYLEQNPKTGEWSIWNNTSPESFKPVYESESDESMYPQPEDLTDPEYEVYCNLMKTYGKADSDDAGKLTIDELRENPEVREKALSLLKGSSYAAIRQWSDEYLEDNLVVVYARWSVRYIDPATVKENMSVDEMYYYLLRDPQDGQWANTDIQGSWIAREVEGR